MEVKPMQKQGEHAKLSLDLVVKQKCLSFFFFLVSLVLWSSENMSYQLLSSWVIDH